MKRCAINILACSLMLILCCTMLKVSAFVMDENIILPEEKISETLSTEIKCLEQQNHDFTDHKIPVWIWYRDIDQTQVDSETEIQTGLTAESLAVDFSMPDPTLINNLENEVLGSQEQMQAYLSRTAVARQLEAQRTDYYIMTRREISREKYTEKSADIINELCIKEDDIIFTSRYSPAIIVKKTVSEINEIIYNNKIESVSLCEEITMQDCTPDSVKETIGLNRVYQNTGLTGKNVKVGMFEQAVPQSSSEYNLSDITIVGKSPSPGGHAVNTAAILMGSKSGMAPEITLFAASGLPYNDSFSYGNLEALIDQGIKVINMSSWFAGTGNKYYNNEDRWIDHISNQHNILMICSAGNYADQKILSPAMAYNTLAIGGYNDKGTASKEDDALYAYSYDNGDGCLKPDVVAPANILGGGTSSSAPVVTGVAALLLQLKPSLEYQPQVLKAILLASCQRKVISTPLESMGQGLTNKQGAGAVDAWNAISIISRRQYGYGEISGAEEKRNFVQPYYGASYMNVSIAWSIDNTVSTTNHAGGSASVGTLHDLDLRVYRSGSVVGSSTNSNSSTEMTYFPMIQGQGMQYQIKVSKYDTTNTEPVRFGYAWSTDKMTFGENLTGTDYPEGLYYIRHRQSGSYLTVDETTGQVKQAPFNGAKNQQWISSKIGADPFTIKTNSSVVSGSLTKAGSGNQAVINDTGNPSIYYFANGIDNTYGIKLADPVTPGTESLLTVQDVHQASSPAVWKYSGFPDRLQWYFEPIGYQRGDVNLDGTIGTSDVLMLQNYIGKAATFDASQKYLADINNDGNINLSDVSLLQRIIAGMD